MKTGIYALCTILTCTAAYYWGKQMENFLPAYAVVGLALVIFILGLTRRSKKAAKRKLREQMFQQHMRMTLRNQWH